MNVDNWQKDQLLKQLARDAEFARQYSRFYAEMFKSVQGYLDAEADYAAIKQAYVDRGMTPEDIVNEEYRANSDWRLKKAIGDCAFFRMRANMFANVLAAVNGKKATG